MRSSFISDAETRSHFAAEEPLRLNFPPFINDILDSIFVCFVAVRKSGATGRSSNLDAVTFVQLLELERVHFAGKFQSHRNKSKFFAKKEETINEFELTLLTIRNENETKTFPLGASETVFFLF